MRKTSKYARKRRFQEDAPKDLWATKILDNKPYSGEVLFGVTPSIEIANNTLNVVKSAFRRIDERVSNADQQTDFEILAHVVVIAQIRTHDIGGEQAQEVLGRLNLAVGALDSLVANWKANRQWVMSGAEALLLEEAIDIYEQILLASTPYEMQEAQTTRLAWFKNVYSKGK